MTRQWKALIPTHSYLAKFYGVCLFIAFVSLLAFDAPGWVLSSLAAVGTIANLEILLILLFSKTAPVDVASLGKVFPRR